MKKKFMLVAVMAVTAVANATSIPLPFLEYSRAPLMAGGETVTVNVLNNGQVHGYRSVGQGPAGRWRQLGTLSATEMQRLRELVKRAAKLPALVAPAGIQFHCAAVPTQKDTYRAPQHDLTLQVDISPCGGSRYNDTRSSLEIVNVLNQHRQMLYR